METRALLETRQRMCISLSSSTPSISESFLFHIDESVRGPSCRYWRTALAPFQSPSPPTMLPVFIYAWYRSWREISPPLNAMCRLLTDCDVVFAGKDNI
jgi:hypothetical protein